MSFEKRSWRSDLAQVARGFLMGGADIIPGVSGGTVALILGIYRQLVTAISHFDMTFLRHVWRRDFKAAAAHTDLRFLVTLFMGIALGIGGLAKLMHYLLEHHFAATFAVFFGFILASCLLVTRMVERWSLASILSLVAGTAFAFWLVDVLPAVPPAGNAYVLLCGAVGICAMILPGISGSFILLIMGKYSDITAALRDVLELRISAAQLAMLCCFAAGCVVGLLVFSKCLRWIMSRFSSPTMAALCGFLIGSLRKIWPFKHDITIHYLEMYDRPLKEIDATKRIYANYWPEEMTEQVGIYLGLIVAAALFVISLDWFTRGGHRVVNRDGETRHSNSKSAEG